MNAPLDEPKGPINRTARLEGEKQRLKKASKEKKFALGLSGFAIALGVVVGAVTVFGSLSYWFWIIPGVAALLLFGGVITYFVESATQSDARESITDLENEIELLGLDKVSETQSSYKLFKIHETDVRRYYQQALSQAKLIFWVGLIIVAFGLGIIAFTAYQLAFRQHEDNLEKIALASIGGVSGILVNFVGLVFMRMFSTTISSLRDFHGRLISTHHLLFGNIIAARISDHSLRDEAWAGMAVAIAKGSAHLEKPEKEKEAAGEKRKEGKKGDALTDTDE